MRRIGLIGSVCINRESSSGQAIRTTILYNHLVDRYGKNRIKLVNTHNKTNKVLLLLKSLLCIFQCQDIIVMVSSNGRRIYYPILSFASKVMHRRVFNNVIGGNYSDYIRTNPKGLYYSKSFFVNWIQMQGQVEELLGLGLSNVELLQNTKEVQALSISDIKAYEHEPFRFCTFSRISIAKGIKNAIETIIRVNEKYNRIIATLDIYGIPDDDYKEDFEKLLATVPSYINYKGYVDYNKSVETLKDYYCLLFPTTFFGEGFPGTVWDALAAGVPTIATDWRYNSEVVIDGKTGYTYPADMPEKLEEKILYALDHVSETNNMKMACIEEARKYTPDIVFPVVYKYFD